MKTKSGRILKEEQLSISFKRFCKMVGVKHKSSHTFRQAYATTMIDEGIPTRQVSNDMGQKVSTTLDGYYKSKKKAMKWLPEKTLYLDNCMATLII